MKQRKQERDEKSARDHINLNCGAAKEVVEVMEKKTTSNWTADRVVIRGVL